MDYDTNINFRIEIDPEFLDSNNVQINLMNLLSQKYLNNIYKDFIILKILKINNISGGKISCSTGKVSYKIDTLCTIRNPLIDSIYTVLITNLNTMGAMCKYDKINVFIPRQYFGTCEPAVDEKLQAKILGKRVEDTIVCIGSFNY